MEYIRRLR